MGSESLFEGGRDANAQSTIQMVEDVLIELGHFVNDCRVEMPNTLRAWRVRKGSAETLITLRAADEWCMLRAVGTVLTMNPGVNRQALFEKLLQLNATDLSGAAFAIEGQQVQVVAERSTLDLDRSEVFSLIDRVRSYSDTWDDKLVVAHGGMLGAQSDEAYDPDEYIEI